MAVICHRFKEICSLKGLPHLPRISQFCWKSKCFACKGNMFLLLLGPISLFKSWFIRVVFFFHKPSKHPQGETSFTQAEEEAEAQKEQEGEEELFWLGDLGWVIFWFSFQRRFHRFQLGDVWIHGRNLERNLDVFWKLLAELLELCCCLELFFKWAPRLETNSKQTHLKMDGKGRRSGFLFGMLS